ncbi:MAG: phosphate ABC transporter substrate-binding protein [ANME-2 cluster archaeon]|nr:phosphate ABC transporter substrate-binding protein [ANME-2 cluster archaeon]MBC2702489.1 phosphate ABC transporter substrate-binding protein [ANME-2 cluster archaeon]MBC2707209.1 phosphate ABC transporter substrate-binding protein [ANME-2 cluster archaeon]MBC2762650.1 phosphate ABC transporter substrate-binding protein [ANME-2 cluster archaeon]
MKKIMLIKSFVQKNKLLLMLAVISMSLLVSGCTDNTNKTVGTDDTHTDNTLADVKLQIAGSTTVLPVAEECARAFMEKHPGSRIFVSGGGSSHGVKAVADGTVDIGTASRDLKSSEIDSHPDLVAHGVAKDGVAVIVHPSNLVTDLTMEQLQGIYTGTITNWKEVGGTDSGIMVVTREEGSGTRDCFEQAVIKPIKAEITDHGIIQDSNGKTRATVAGSAQAIGFISLGYVNSDVSALRLDGIEPTVESVVDGSYAISRTLWMISNGNPDSSEKAFLDFVLGDEGQRIVEDVHFIPVN